MLKLRAEIYHPINLYEGKEELQKVYEVELHGIQTKNELMVELIRLAEAAGYIFNENEKESYRE